MNNSPYNRRLKTPRYIKIVAPHDIWSHIYGLASFLGLVITVVILYYSYTYQTEDKDFKFVLLSLVSLLIAVLLIFFVSVLYFNKRIKKLGTIPELYNFYREEFQKQDIIVNQLSECSHIVAHYFRNLDISMQEVLDADQSSLTDDDIISVVNKFEYFLINITTNLQAYFSQITDDNCSITIKLINLHSDAALLDLPVRTYFRDPVNFKKRREGDGENNGKCTIEQNTAFNIIMDNSFADIYFAEDNLDDLYNSHSYKNPNSNWYNNYKSTLVVPISIVTGRKERNILGFLSVDNFKGGLAVNANKEYLFFVADILYLGFSKFDRIIELATSKNIQNEKIERYTNWN